jgi:protein-disulfide isomerase
MTEPGADAIEESKQETANGPDDSVEGAAARTPDRDFIRFRRFPFYAALVPVAFVTGLAVGFLAWGRSVPTTNSLPESLGAVPAAPTDGPRMEVSVDDDPALGPADAPITIVEFSDFNCPYCQRFQQQTFQPLMDAYPDQIRFVYRDFPITSQDSFYAAQAAECADEQGSYWEYHDALFTGAYGLGDEAYRQYAEELGLDADALVSCVDEGRYADEVQADAREAASLGVSGTPTFFINGVPLVGAQPLTRFAQVIDSELN